MKIYLRILQITFGILFLPMSMLWSQTDCYHNQALRLVVIGSSTAEGAGASVQDSSWVNRYRTYLQDQNPEHVVINLARGGYNSYRLQADDFVPPAGRPTPDSARNISHAFRQNPDAIIVNLPSNDTGSGYGVAEQVSNFRQLAQVADQASVSIWISTTQPRNYDSSRIEIQERVRDSILAIFGTQAIDFWNVIAEPDGTINPDFDSGDGVHVNDGGHSLLFQQVVNKDLPKALYQLPATVDYALQSIELPEEATCTRRVYEGMVRWINVGQDDANGLGLAFKMSLLNDPTTDYQIVDSLPALGNCRTDSLPFFIDIPEPGLYEIEVILQSARDNNLLNDTLRLLRSFEQTPDVLVQTDTLCLGETALLSASSNSAERYFWYQDPTGMSLGNAPQFTTLPLDSTSIYYLQAAQGLPYYSDVIRSTDFKDVNWNGYMFDMVAHEDLLLDSLAVKINTMGDQAVLVYTKSGSHLGFEENAAAWTLLEEEQVLVEDSNALEMIVLDNALAMNAGDTLAVYLQMKNAGAELSYRRVPNPVIERGEALSLLLGSGSNFNFNGSYYPREWNGQLYYHYGDRPLGACPTDLIPVEALVSEPLPDLGRDTMIGENENLVLSLPTTFAFYKWSNGSTEAELEIVGGDYIPGVYQFGVEVTDEWGCVGSDSISVEITPFTNTSELANAAVRWWPNPGHDYLHIALETGVEWGGAWRFRIVDVSGGVVMEREGLAVREVKIATTGFAAGMYWIEIVGAEKKTTLRWLKI